MTIADGLYTHWPWFLAGFSAAMCLFILWLRFGKKKSPDEILKSVWPFAAAILVIAIATVIVHRYGEESAEKEAADRAYTELAKAPEETPAETADAGTNIPAYTAGPDLLVETPAETPFSGLAILLDGEAVSSLPITGDEEEPLRVWVMLGDNLLADLPFGEWHKLQIIQYAGQNTVRMTADAVYMEDADCHGQDCVRMGELTRDNYETQSMGGFIVCLPHRITIQVGTRD